MFFFHLVQFTSFKFGSTSFRKLTSIGLRLEKQKTLAHCNKRYAENNDIIHL